jgi:Flp pilus assembly protein TadG
LAQDQSAEVGLPLGTQLAGIIGKKMDIRFGDFGMKHIGSGDAELFAQVVHWYRQEANAYQEAAWLIRDGISLARSIDDFLDLHRSNAYVNRYGKAAIARAILEAERQSKLYFASDTGLKTFDPNEVAHTWLVKFMHRLVQGYQRRTFVTYSIMHLLSSSTMTDALSTFSQTRCRNYTVFEKRRR